MNVCNKCGVRLSSRNWFPSYEKNGQMICKTCSNIRLRKAGGYKYMKRYWETHPLAYEKHKARVRANSKKRYEEGKTWKQRNPEEAKAYAKKYREEHREQFNAYMREYQKRKRERNK